MWHAVSNGTRIAERWVRPGPLAPPRPSGLRRTRAPAAAVRWLSSLRGYPLAVFRLSCDYRRLRSLLASPAATRGPSGATDGSDLARVTPRPPHRARPGYLLASGPLVRMCRSMACFLLSFQRRIEAVLPWLHDALGRTTYLHLVSGGLECQHAEILLGVDLIPLIPEAFAPLAALQGRSARQLWRQPVTITSRKDSDTEPEWATGRPVSGPANDKSCRTELRWNSLGVQAGSWRRMTPHESP